MPNFSLRNNNHGWPKSLRRINTALYKAFRELLQALLYTRRSAFTSNRSSDKYEIKKQVYLPLALEPILSSRKDSLWLPVPRTAHEKILEEGKSYDK